MKKLLLLLPLLFILTGCESNILGAGKLKEWEKPGKEHLKLKVDKSKVLKYEAREARVALPDILGASGSSSTSTKLILNDSNSTTTKFVYYTYESTDIRPTEEYNGQPEERSLRRTDAQIFNAGDKLVMKYYGNQTFSGVNNEFQVREATTTIEAFDEQTAEPLVYKLLNGANALTSTSSTNVKDTGLVCDNPTYPYGNEIQFYASNLYSGCTYHGLISFTTPNISGTISQTKLWLSLDYQYPAGVARPVEVYQTARSNWAESQATYNVYSSGNNWTTPGGDKTGSVIATNPGSTSLGWLSWDVTSYATSFNSTYDLFLKLVTESGNNQTYYKTKENSATTERPYLEITYTSGGGFVPTSNIINFE